MATISNKKNGNKSLKEQVAMLERYNKVKSEQKALTFAPATKKKPTCAYCKKDGHWCRDNKTRETTCPKLINKDKYALLNNAKKRARERSWQEQTSAKAAEGGEGGGWKTTGSSDKTASKLEHKKPVVRVANAYDFGDDEWNEIGAERQRAAEEREREEEKKKAREEAAELAMGKWTKPFVTEVVEEKTVEDANKCAGCGDWGCPDCN